MKFPRFFRRTPEPPSEPEPTGHPYKPLYNEKASKKIETQSLSQFEQQWERKWELRRQEMLREAERIHQKAIRDGWKILGEFLYREMRWKQLDTKLDRILEEVKQ